MTRHPQYIVTLSEGRNATEVEGPAARSLATAARIFLFTTLEPRSSNSNLEPNP